MTGAAAKAKASGLLRNWGAKDKYIQAEPLVLQAHASLEDDEELDEEALLDFAPQLQEFEAETLQTLLAQSRRHGDYELAARALLVRQKERLDAVNSASIVKLPWLAATSADIHRPQKPARWPVAYTASPLATQAHQRELRLVRLELEAQSTHDKVHSKHTGSKFGELGAQSMHEEAR